MCCSSALASCSNWTPWSISRGYPSMRKPLLVASSLVILSRIKSSTIRCNKQLTVQRTSYNTCTFASAKSAWHHTKGTSSPRSIVAFKSWPRAEPDATSSRKRSPLDKWVKPYFSTMRSHCVPLPQPGPPEREITMLFNEILWGIESRRVARCLGSVKEYLTDDEDNSWVLQIWKQWLDYKHGFWQQNRVTLVYTRN